MFYSNEFIFIIHVAIIGFFALAALKFGKHALIAFISTCCIAANLFVVKQITLFGLDATCSDAFTVGAVFGLNLLQEYYGRPITKTAIWVSFFLMVFYAIVCQLHISYIPNSYDTMQAHYNAILAFMPRITMASFTVYLIVQQLDSYLYGILKNKFTGRYLTARNYISIGICQLIDTVLFSFLGLYGIVHSVWDVIAISYTVKVIVILLTTPYILLSKHIHSPT